MNASSLRTLCFEIMMPARKKAKESLALSRKSHTLSLKPTKGDHTSWQARKAKSFPANGMAKTLKGYMFNQNVLQIVPKSCYIPLVIKLL